MKKLLTALGAAAALTAVSAVPAGATAVYKHPKMHRWAVQAGKGYLTSIDNDETAISNDATAGNDSAVVTDCQNFRNDVEIAQAGTPIPDGPVQRQWTAVLNEYDQAAIQCVAGFNDNDANGEIEQSTSDMTSGNALLTHLTKSL